MDSLSKESRIQMAIDAIRKNQFKTLKEAASSYDVPRSTLQDRMSGVASRAHQPANCQKLSKNMKNLCFQNGS